MGPKAAVYEILIMIIIVEILLKRGHNLSLIVKFKGKHWGYHSKFFNVGWWGRFLPSRRVIFVHRNYYELNSWFKIFQVQKNIIVSRKSTLARNPTRNHSWMSFGIWFFLSRFMYLKTAFRNIVIMCAFLLYFTIH